MNDKPRNEDLTTDILRAREKCGEKSQVKKKKGKNNVMTVNLT